ncbi:MAG TPA: hypothetical protein VHA56_20110 [Mucilaginibacter sp.]|nr:hypothetical protein [Mucilaginibacter sp.]
MKKVCTIIFAAVIIAAVAQSCKLDEPVYPDNITKTQTGADTTVIETPINDTTVTDTTAADTSAANLNNGDGLPIDNASNITIKIGDVTYNFTDNTAFTVLAAGSAKADSLSAPNGQTTLVAHGNTQLDSAIVVFPAAVTGTFALSEVKAGNYLIDLTVPARVKVTVLTATNIQGTFSVDMVDVNDKTKVYKHCQGSFNIQK